MLSAIKAVGTRHGPFSHTTAHHRRSAGGLSVAVRSRFHRTSQTAMLKTLGQALGFGGGSSSDACAGCSPETLGCKPAEPGSVTPHDAHLLVKLPAPAGADAGATDEAWWPERVDDEAPIVALNQALKEHKDALGGKKVKVTAFDGLQPAPLGAAAGTTDLLVFPGALLFKGLPLAQLPAAALACMADGGGSLERAAAAAAKGGWPAPQQLGGVTLLVCCHMKRDNRCAVLGPPLAAKLEQLSRQRGLGPEAFRVFKSSHVGGHVHAGNVICYVGSSSSSEGQAAALDGDWFGGVTPDNAEAFLDALLAAKAPSGGAGDPTLRQFWRGRVGKSKQEQVECFQAALADVEDLGAK